MPNLLILAESGSIAHDMVKIWISQPKAETMRWRIYLIYGQAHKVARNSPQKNMHNDTMKRWVRTIFLAEVVSWFRNVPTMFYICC